MRNLMFTVSAVPVVGPRRPRLLFVENRERRLLRNIERTMKLTIPEAELPDAEMISQRRQEKLLPLSMQKWKAATGSVSVHC